MSEAEQDLAGLESESAPIVDEESTEVSQEETEQVETPEAENGAEPQEQREQDGIQKRFAKITEQKYTALQRAEAAEARALLAEQKLSQLQPKDPPPNEDDFDTDGEYYAALAKHEARQAVEALKVEQAQSIYQSDINATHEKFLKRVEATDIPDYGIKAQSLADSGLFPGELLPDLWGLDNADSVIAYLADHPEVTRGLTSVGLGSISARMSAPKPVQKTKASAPIKPTKPGGAITKKLSEMSAAEIIDGDLSAHGFQDR